MPVRPDAAVQIERRGNSAPIPSDLDTFLNRQQILTLRSIENFGWRLAFVRQPLYQEPVTFVISPGHQRLAVLETDGRVDLQPDIPLRDSCDETRGHNSR